MSATKESAPRIDMLDVQSSQIHSIGHDPTTNTLAIRFFKGYGSDKTPGSLYHYSGFSSEDFAAFRAAESLGKHFRDHIKPHADKYPYRRVDVLPATAA
ncbi:KTSC domain-containing protein [Dyella sp.]|uniref:KTSC domain-containing protein n=1 Tax=Dyella sp. TaxID=1869338 RepID=UPI002FD8F2D8